jgi:hypothetical protein
MFNRFPPSSYTNSVQWPHSRFKPKFQMSRSGFSLLEEQMQERRRSCSGCAIPRTVRRYTGLIVHRELAIGYVPVSGCAFGLIVIVGSTQLYNRGWARLFLLVKTDRENSAHSVASITSKTSWFSRITRVTFFMTPVGSNLGVTTS